MSFLNTEPERGGLQKFLGGRTPRTGGGTSNIIPNQLGLIPRKTDRVGITEEQTAAFLSAFPDLEDERDAYLAGTIGEDISEAVRIQQETQPTGLMGAVASGIEKILPFVEGDYFADKYFGTELVEKRKNFQEKSIIHAIGGEATAGMISPLTALELALLFSPGSAKQKLAQIGASRIGRKALSKGLQIGLRQIPTKQIPSAVRNATSKMAMGTTRDISAVKAIFPSMDNAQIKQALRIANTLVGSDVPKTVAERGAAASAGFILLRNGTIDASAYAAMTGAEEAGMPASVVLAVGLVGGVGGYWSAGKVGSSIADPRQLRAQTKLPEAKVPDILAEVNNVYAKQTYPEGAEAISTRKSGKKRKPRDRAVKTPSILEYRTIVDTLQEEGVRVTRTRGTPEQVVSGTGEAVPFTGKGSYYKDESYFIDPVTGDRIIDPATGKPRSQKDRVLGGAPFAKSYVDVRINPVVLRNEFDALPEHGYGWIRPSYNKELDTVRYPGRSYYDGATDEERFANFTEYVKLQETIKADPKLFGADMDDLSDLTRLTTRTDQVWAATVGRGVVYADSLGPVYAPSAMDDIIANPLKDPIKEKLSSVTGKKTIMGIHESINSRTRAIADAKEQQYLGLIESNRKKLQSIFYEQELPVATTGATKYIYRLKSAPEVVIPRYAFLSNPTKFRQVLGDHLTADEYNMAVKSAIDLTNVSNDVRLLIEQTGGGLSKYRSSAEIAELNRTVDEAAHPNGRGSEPWDTSYNLNFVPNVIQGTGDAIFQMGDDGARFIILDEDQLLRIKDIDPNRPTYLAGDQYTVHPVYPGRIRKPNVAEQVIDQDGVILDVPYRSTDEMIDEGTFVYSPEDSMKMYIEDGLSMFHQRHVYNEMLSLTDGNSDLARMLYYSMNWGDPATNLDRPYTYRGLIETTNGTDVAKANIKKITQQTSQMTQPKTIHELGTITDVVNKYNSIGIYAGTTMDFGAVLTLGSLAIGSNFKYLTTPVKKNYLQRNKIVANAFAKSVAEFFRNKGNSDKYWSEFITSPRVQAALQRGAVVYDSSPETLARELATGPMPKFLQNLLPIGDRSLMARFQGAFVQTLNELRINGAAYQIELDEIRRGFSLNAQEKWNVQNSWNTMTGAATRMEGQLKRAGEWAGPFEGFNSNQLMFAARFTTAQFQTLTSALIRGGPEGRVAASAIRNFFGGISAMVFIANAANKDSHIDPFDSINPIDLDALRSGEFRFNSNWLTIGTGNTEYDLGMMIKPLAGLIFETPINLLIRENAEATSWSILDDTIKAIDNMKMRKASPALGRIWEMTAGGGYDFHSRPLFPYRKMITYETKETLANEDAPVDLGRAQFDWTGTSDWRGMTFNQMRVLAPFWANAGIDAFLEQLDYLDENDGVAFPFDPNAPEENKKRFEDMGITSLYQAGVEFFAGKIRFTSPKEKIELIALRDREINDSIPPKQLKDFTPAQYRALEEKYPNEFRVYRDYEIESGVPDRKRQAFREIFEIDTQTNYELLRHFQVLPDARGNYLEQMSSVSTMKDGIRVDTLRDDKTRKQLIDEAIAIRAKGYERKHKKREEFGLLLNQGSNGRKVQNAVRLAYEISKLPDETGINFDLLDKNLGQLELDIAAGKDEYGAKTEQEISDNLAVFYDLAPPTTGITFLDQAISYKRLVSQSGWWDLKDEAIQKFGKEYYSIYSKDGEPIQTFDQLLREITLLENNRDQLADINAAPSVVAQNKARLSKANKLLRQANKYVTEQRNLLIAHGDKVFFTEDRPIKTGQITITGNQLKKATEFLGLRTVD